LVAFCNLSVAELIALLKKKMNPALSFLNSSVPPVSAKAARKKLGATFSRA